MSYTDDVERPFAGARTNRMRRAAMRGHRFNGFDYRIWGMRLARYAHRPARLRTWKAARLTSRLR